MLEELIKVIQQEHHSYKDPVTEFLECLYVNYDFDGAQQKLIECEQVTLRLFFLQFSRPQFCYSRVCFLYYGKSLKDNTSFFCVQNILL
ncbi:Eukaryotic translation initiation factor 3 subunit E [Zea mays]|nr:Eukaryotic translation initiation factor 3 subunit E [Zea mays]